MKVGLIDIDSKIPNLALMKISSYWKSKGHQVEMTSPLFAGQYDRIFASKVFDYTELPVLPDRTIVGGSGYSLNFHLPGDVENLSPDYSLYGCDCAMGFTSRGCNRKCPWCIVPEKEGKFRPVCDIYQFWGGQRRLMLLDNSLNTDEEHFERILNQLIKHQIRTSFNQGLDIRFFTEKQAYLLSRVRLWGRIHFAWDLMAIEKSVREGIRILKKYGLNDRWTVAFYVLIGFNTTQQEDLYRVRTLKDLGIDPVIMPFNKFAIYQSKFARWVNRKAIFYSCGWEEYKRR